MKKSSSCLLIVVILVLGYFGFKVVSANSCPDTDQDGLTDCEEVKIYYTERFDSDTDNDSYLDGDEIDNGFSPHYGNQIKLSDVDSDHDGLFDDQEIDLGTKLLSLDSDNDGFTDFEEQQEKTLDSKSSFETFRDTFIK